MLKRFKLSIQARLISAFSLVFLLFALIAGGISFYETYHETHEFQDGLLKQTATYINPTAPLATVSDIDSDAQINVDTPATPHPHAISTEYLSAGFHNVKYDDEDYRMYIRDTEAGRITVWQDNEYRQELAARAAWSGVLPPLLLIPFIAIITMWIVRRAFRSVRTLSNSLQQRQDTDLTPLNTENLPKEIQGFVHAINQLLTRTDRAIQQQQRFIADAAHELRTPMTALSVQAERLNHLPLAPEHQSSVQQLQAGIRRNRYLLEQLLQHARAQAPEAQRPCSEVSVQTLFRQIIQDVLPLAEQKQQDLGVTTEQDAILHINELDAYTLIKTIVDNAIRYAPNDSQIDLAVHEHEQHIILSVEDNGMGIPTTERERVFDPFYRVLGTDEEGTGLGLAIAQTIARRYGGEIVLKDSVQFERGLLVEICLPKNIVN